MAIAVNHIVLLNLGHYHKYQGGLTPIICYTRSNFYINRGKVTIPTIIGDVFPSHDFTITFIELILDFLSCLAHSIVHLPYTMSLQTLPTVNLTCWPTEPVLSLDRCSMGGVQGSKLAQFTQSEYWKRLYWQLHALDALRELNGVIIWAQVKIHKRRLALCLQQNSHISGGRVIQCLDQYNLDVGVSVWLSCHPPPSTSTIWSRHPHIRFTTAMTDIMNHLHELSHITHQCAWGKGKICTYCHSSS